MNKAGPALCLNLKVKTRVLPVCIFCIFHKKWWSLSPQPLTCTLLFFLRFYLFIHDRKEREAETQAEGEAGSQWGGLGPQDYDLSQRQTFNHWATQVPLHSSWSEIVLTSRFLFPSFHQKQLSKIRILACLFPLKWKLMMWLDTLPIPGAPTSYTSRDRYSKHF